MFLIRLNLDRTVGGSNLGRWGQHQARPFLNAVLLLIPPEYSLSGILGYLSFFTSDYKHKTIVKAGSAINASLLFMDTGTAILNRERPG